MLFSMVGRSFTRRRKEFFMWPDISCLFCVVNIQDGSGRRRTVGDEVVVSFLLFSCTLRYF